MTKPNALRIADNLAGSPNYTGTGIWEAVDIIRRQHEAIDTLREALDSYMTGDMIATGFGSGVGGNYFRNAEQALEATKEFVE